MRLVKYVLGWALFLLISVAIMASCAKDPYKDYVATNLPAKTIAFQHTGEEYDNQSSIFNKAVIFSDYEEYSKRGFDLDYTKGYFENNDLLVFIVTCCSTDGMEFVEILEKDGVLAPLFERNYIGPNQASTDDFIVMAYCVELPKSSNYSVGEIAYKYR